MTKAFRSACRTKTKSTALSSGSQSEWLDRVADRYAGALRRLESNRPLLRAWFREGSLDHVWYELNAHPYQQWDRKNDWTVFLLLGGRGAGKTRAGAEWVREFVRDRTAPARIALVSETYADGREVMIEGNSGLGSIGPDERRPRYEPSRRRLVFPSGSVAYVFSSEDPDGLRGHQFDAAWSDELCKWKHAEETWSNLQLALRLGERPRQVVTTTPRPTALLKRILAAKGTLTHRATTYDNSAHLSAAFLDEIASVYEGTRLGRQELLGEIVEDVAGALWTHQMIEACRISVPPGFHAGLDRIVVAVDPPATAGENADECGIVVAGVLRSSSPACGGGVGEADEGGESQPTALADGARPLSHAARDSSPVNGGAEERTSFILADRSAGGLSPRQWAVRAVAAYHEFGADRIVVETNQGGDMVREIVRGVDPSVPVREAHATRGKRLRAEPVAALYEQGLVRHVASFPKLEDQMTNFTGEGGKSPDRLDALVWALTDLMLRPAAEPRIKRIL